MSDVFLAANNAATSLALPMSPTDAILEVQTGAGLIFPAPGAGQYFVGTISDPLGAIREVVKVSAVSGDVMTVARAQEGTTALPWPAGSLFQNLWTDGQVSALLQLAQLTSALVLSTLAPGAGLVGKFLMSNGPNQVPTWEFPLTNALPPPGMVDLGYTTLPDLTSVHALNPPPGATLAILEPESGNVRWRADGTNPTGDSGNPLWGTAQLQFQGNLSAFKAINMTGSTATLNVQFYGP